MNIMRLGFFASHRGSNMQTVIDACRDGRLCAKPAVVISNNCSSMALQRAKKEGIPGYWLSGQTHPEPASLDKAILWALKTHRVDLVVLAGYMKRIGPRTIEAYRGKIINIHPALLPKYGGRGMYGIHVHEAVLAAGDTETGVTVHIVDEEYDHGPVLAQRTVPVKPGDTPESLAERVLAVEHRFLVETLQRIVGGEIVLPTG